jgi:O-antigen ligase
LSLLAVLIFWLSFTRHPESYAAARWLLRVFLIFVIIAARTRISIITFVLAGFARLILSARDPLKRFVAVSATAGVLLTFLILNISFSRPWATGTIDYLRRGQTKASLTTLTSRTLIWNHVLPKTLETPIIGHGYGVSRLTMGRPRNAGFQPLHCHNALLEVFFSTGFLGLFPFMLTLAYSLKWIWDYARLREVFSTDLALHAVCCVVILLGSSFSEAILGVRLSPVQPLFFLYLLALDRKVALGNVPVRSESRRLLAEQSIRQPLMVCR